MCRLSKNPPKPTPQALRKHSFTSEVHLSIANQTILENLLSHVPHGLERYQGWKRSPQTISHPSDGGNTGETGGCPERRQDAQWCVQGGYGASRHRIAIGAIVGYIVNLPIPPKPLRHMAHSPIPQPPTSLRKRLIAQNDPWCHIAPEALRTHPEARAHDMGVCQGVRVLCNHIVMIDVTNDTWCDDGHMV